MIDSDELKRRLGSSEHRRILSRCGFDLSGERGDDLDGILGPKALGEGDTGNFSVDLQKGRVKDWGSTGYKGDVLDVVQDTQGLDFTGALRWIVEELNLDLESDGDSANQSKSTGKASPTSSRGPDPVVSHDLASTWNKRLMGDESAAEAARRYLKDRALTGEVLKAARVGLAHQKEIPDGDKWGGFYRSEARRADWWIMFPVTRRERDESPIVSIKGVAFDASAEDWERNEEGEKIPSNAGSVALWNLVPSKDGNSSLDSPVVVCEGEVDALSALSHGFNAVTGTGGAGTFKDEWAPYVARMEPAKQNGVVVAYDGDEKGRANAPDTAEKLHNAGLNPRIVPLPDDTDVNDILVEKGEAGLHDCIGQAEAYAVSESENSTSKAAAKNRVDEVVKKVQGGDARDGLVFEHLEDFARLDATDFAIAKSKISDAVNMNDFKQALREKRRKVEREDFHQSSDLPAIQLSGRAGRRVVDEAKEALHNWNDPPTLFQRGTELAQIATDDQGRPIIRELPESVLDDRLDRAADFYRNTKNQGATRADLPKRYVQRIQDTVALPPLDGIVEVPVLREDGSVLDDPGYDEGSRLYYRPDEDLDIPGVPQAPTKEEIQRAKEKIWTPLQDFPFVDQASKANALGLMLTPIIRPHLGGQNVPLAIVDATVQGTGKTLFVNVVSLTATGRTAGTMNAPESDEEWRKQITAQLLQGASMIVVDNVRGHLRSAPLEQALTTSLWQDRVLGKSQQVELPQRATWVATGNNVQPKGDMKRRVYPVRMDAEMERPWTGRDFEIDNLRKWAEDHRGELVASLLTLARGWIAAGKPEPDVELLGSFEEWTRTVGGVLQHAGVEGFLDNLETLYEQVDDETAEWAGFLEALHAYFEGASKQSEREEAAFTSKELGRMIRDSYQATPRFRDRGMQEVVEQLPDYILQKLSRGEPISRTLGNMFSHRKGRRFGPDEWRIEVAYTQNRTKRWIVRGNPKNNESNESSYTTSDATHPHPKDKVGGSSQNNTVEPDSSDSYTDTSFCEFDVGDRVETPSFGTGEVKGGSGDPPKVLVEISDGSVRRFSPGNLESAEAPF
jgi:DNA primase